MNGAVFFETLARSWRQVLYWGLGLGFWGYVTVLTLPSVDMLKQYEQLLESFPPAMLQMFGAKDAAVLATPNGYLGFGFLTYLLIILLFYVVMAGLNFTAVEEDEGILDMVLALPLARSRIVIEKFAAYALMLLGILVIAYVGTFAAIATSTLEYSVDLLALSGFNTYFGLLAVLTFTALLAVVVRRKNTAMGIVVVILTAMYVINFLGNAATGTLAGTLRTLSFFRYADGQYVVIEGFNAAYPLLLAVVAALCLAATIWCFERRDVGV